MFRIEKRRIRPLAVDFSSSEGNFHAYLCDVKILLNSKNLSSKQPEESGMVLRLSKENMFVSKNKRVEL